MKHIINIILVALCCIPNLIFASNLMADSATTEMSDTLCRSKNLDEVVVEAKSVYAVKSGMAYVPSKLNAETAADASMLLKRLPISDIDFDGQSIVSKTGESGRYYIDGLQADYTEVTTLLPKDIKRVEILRFPTSGAFMGEPLVVNIVTRRFDLGGYAIASAYQKLNMMSGYYNVLGKFVKGKSTLQFKAQTGINNLYGDHGSTTESYNLPDLKTGDDLHISRYSKILGSKNKSYSPTFGLQWNRNTSADKWWLLARIGFSQRYNPKMNQWGVVKDYETAEEEYRNNRSWKNISPSAGLYMGGIFNNGSKLQGGLAGSFSNNKSTSEYDRGNLSVNYQNKERSGNIQGYLYYYFPLKKNNAFTAYADFSESFFNTKYTGTGRNEKSKFHNSEYLFTTSYSQVYYIKNDGSYAHLYLGFNLPINVTRFENMDNITAVCYQSTLSFIVNLKGKHSISLGMSVKELPRPLSYMARKPQYETDILTSVGNTKLKNGGSLSSSITYSLYPLNWFNATVSAAYQRDWDMITNRYFAYDGHIYSKPVNSCSMDMLYMKVSGSFELFKRSLFIKPSLYIQRDIIKGLQNDSYWKVLPYITASYMHKSGFSADISYTAPLGKSFSPNSNEISKNYNHYLDISLNYTKRNVSASIMVSPLNKYSHSSSYTLQPGVDNVTEMWNRNSGRSISASIRYTIDFGRRYKHDEDIDVLNLGKTSLE